MKLGSVITVTGLFTQELFIAGRTLSEIEHILGFFNSRFFGGMAIAALLQYPEIGEFELGARVEPPEDPENPAEAADPAILKAEAMSTWRTMGLQRLVKVLSVANPDPNMKADLAMRAGFGAPQFNAKVPLRARIVDIIPGYPFDRYLAGGFIPSS
jgi:hypothetical protein